MFTSDDDLTLAHTLADTADAMATGYFRQPDLQRQIKADGSPVTEADRLVEAALREDLLRHRPGDTFVGEETGTRGHGGRSWFVDPIDGTRAFMAGLPDWRTLIAVEDAGTITMGLVSSPELHRRWWAIRTGGAWTRHNEDTRDVPLAVTETARLEQAAVGLWPVEANIPGPLRAAVNRLVARSAPTGPQEGAAEQPPPERSTAGGTGHGALLVATGQIDAFLFYGAGPWDLAAMVPIVEEAGGRFSDVTGRRSLDAPVALFSNGVLHEQILHCLLNETQTEAR